MEKEEVESFIEFESLIRLCIFVYLFFFSQIFVFIVM